MINVADIWRAAGAGNTYSELEFTQLRNQTNESSLTSMISSLQPSTNLFSSVSSNLLYDIYDNKALTPQLINNYLNKAQAVLDETTVDLAGSSGPKQKYMTIVDEILENVSKDEAFELESGEEAASTSGDSVNPQTEPAASTSEPSNFDHYGIVGEIFDKYA